MKKILQIILVFFNILALIVVLRFPRSSQAYTEEKVSNRANTASIVAVITLKQLNQQIQEFNIPTKVSSVEQISDVSPSDPYFDALKTLIERYQMDITLPDGTFKGNQPITRGEVIIYLNDTISVAEEFIAPEEEEARNRELKLRLDNLSSQIAQKDSDFAEKLAEIEQIEARLDELESRIEQDDKLRSCTKSKIAL